MLVAEQASAVAERVLAAEEAAQASAAEERAEAASAAEQAENSAAALTEFLPRNQGTAEQEY